MCSFFTSEHPNKIRFGSDVTLMWISTVLPESVSVAVALSTPSTGLSCLVAKMN